ncbi:MAG TPA: hypothetical protein VGN81_13990 [Pseudonocardiaceae bacterium]
MLARIGGVVVAVPILFLAAAPAADAAVSVGPAGSVGRQQVMAPDLRICLLPIICISIGDGPPHTQPPPPPPPTSPPPPPPTTPTTPTQPPTSPPTTTHSAPPPPPPVTPTAPTTPTTSPPLSPPASPVGRAQVLPTSPGTLKVASVSPEVVTERRWALTAIVLIFGGGAVATARARRRAR